MGKYSKVNLKYDVTEYPFSIIKSKKLTALAVHAIIDSANNIMKKDLKTSLKKVFEWNFLFKKGLMAKNICEKQFIMYLNKK